MNMLKAHLCWVILFFLIINQLYSSNVSCMPQATWYISFEANFTEFNSNVGYLKGKFSLLLNKITQNQEAITEVRGIIRTSGSQYKSTCFEFEQQNLEDNITQFFGHIETEKEDRFKVIQHPEIFPWDSFELGFLLSFNETAIFNRSNIHISIILDPSIEDYWCVYWVFNKLSQPMEEQLMLVGSNKSIVEKSESLGFQSHYLLSLVFTRRVGDVYSYGIMLWMLAIISLTVFMILFITYVIYKCGGPVSILSVFIGMPLYILFELMKLSLSYLTFLHYFVTAEIVSYIFYVVRVFTDYLGPKIILCQEKVEAYIHTKGVPTAYRVTYTAKNLGGKDGRIRNFTLKDVYLDPATTELQVNTTFPETTRINHGGYSQLNFKIEFRPSTAETVELIKNLRNVRVTYEYEVETAIGFKKKDKEIKLI